MSFRARNRQALRLRPVNSLKHIVDTASFTTGVVITEIPLIQAVASPVLNNVTQVEQGCTVSSIFLRVEVLGSAEFVQVPRIYMAIMKKPGGNPANVSPNAVGQDDDKRFVIHQEMTMVSNQTGGLSTFPRTMFQGVIKIPRSYKRFGFNDELVALFQNSLSETTGIVNVCVQCIYKEFK